MKKVISIFLLLSISSLILAQNAISQKQKDNKINKTNYRLIIGTATITFCCTAIIFYIRELLLEKDLKHQISVQEKAIKVFRNNKKSPQTSIDPTKQSDISNESEQNQKNENNGISQKTDYNPFLDNEV